MKLKNLLLAGLTIAAMTACSNDNEFVDNGNQTKGEEASMRINLKFANEVNTRADAPDDKSGDKKAGEDFEIASANVTAIIEYPNSNKRLVYKNLTLVPGNAGTYQTNAFSVEAGSNVNVYAIVNYGEDAANKLNIEKLAELTVGAQTLPDVEESLAYIANTVAKKDAFLMSGKVEKVNIEAGSKENKARISVDRVAAKLDERTPEDPFIIIDGNKIYNTKEDVSILITGFSFSNLSSDSYVFSGETSPSSWLQKYVPAGEKADSTTYRWIKDNITYCLENNTGNPTKVHYKGQVCLGGKALKDNFYIRAVTLDNKTIYRLFTSWEELTGYYNDDTISKLDKDAIETLAKYGINKYFGGVCYYEADIKTHSPEESTSVLRNNWYELKVKTISKIGYPTPTPEIKPEDTMLDIITTVNPWTIQVNNFEL
ncbi:Mfa1 family fimbria major subunit [uncultured Bacteroides sp.]|uniref:Mfa1 family fimbria major subunit n=1 Tax=uncultured Bacteroides sp. TaxID=162156 RepID=UPI0025D5F301|nr:Mfa1 family fimbria major subunit [uncultured Bacteroides sp.]